MSIVQKTKHRKGTVWLKEGRIYSFKYLNYQHDPAPVVICISIIRGKHPRTGHFHDYMQAVNFTYIPRDQRKIFAANWAQMMEAYAGNVPFTWAKVNQRYGWMRTAVRRYLLGPAVIKELKEIPVEDIEMALRLSWARDFSKKVSAKASRLMRSARGIW